MKIINANTKISELIKENPKSIEAIASLAKPLEKLKNPILRKIMASRVTIAEAAKMGGTSVEAFQRVLSPLGFSFNDESENKPVETTENQPVWLATAAPENIEIYDVRSIIDNGADPLKEILHRFKTVKPGKILCIVNGFVPTPLIHLLKQEKAEDAFVKTVNDKEFHTYFLKKSDEDSQPIEKTSEKLNNDTSEIFAEVCSRFETYKTREIDVRELEMPEPMHKILSELEQLPMDHALYVHHKRIPVYLLEELADKDFEVHLHTVTEGEVKMLIFKR